MAAHVTSKVFCESSSRKMRDKRLNREIRYLLKEPKIVIEKWRLPYRPSMPAACSPSDAYKLNFTGPMLSFS